MDKRVWYVVLIVGLFLLVYLFSTGKDIFVYVYSREGQTGGLVILGAGVYKLITQFVWPALKDAYSRIRATQP